MPLVSAGLSPSSVSPRIVTSSACTRIMLLLPGQREALEHGAGADKAGRSKTRSARASQGKRVGNGDVLSVSADRDIDRAARGHCIDAVLNRLKGIMY